MPRVARIISEINTWININQIGNPNTKNKIIARARETELQKEKPLVAEIPEIEEKKDRKINANIKTDEIRKTENEETHMVETDDYSSDDEEGPENA